MEANVRFTKDIGEVWREIDNFPLTIGLLPLCNDIFIVRGIPLIGSHQHVAPTRENPGDKRDLNAKESVEKSRDGNGDVSNENCLHEAAQRCHAVILLLRIFLVIEGRDSVFL